MAGPDTQRAVDTSIDSSSLGGIALDPFAGQQALRDLLEPLDPNEFATEHWERRPFHSRGSEERVAGLRFGLDAFWSAAERAGPKLKATGPNGGIGISADQAKAAFASGQTVVIDDIDTQHPPARSLCALVKAGLGHVGTTTINCYLSPAGGGYGLHFDQHSVLLLQLSGAKSWKYGDTPAVESPDEHWADLHDAARPRPTWASSLVPPPETDLKTCRLTPGGVLYLPSGTWHRGRAEGHSLAFTLTFGPARFNQVLQSLLSPRLRDDARQRQYIPLRSQVDARREFLSSRLREARALVESITVDDLERLCAERTHSFSLPDRPRPAPARLRRRDLLLPPDWLGTTVSPAGDTFRLFYLNKKLTFPASAKPFIERLMSQHSAFVAGEACCWGPDEEPLEWDEVRPALEMFLAHGLLRHSPAEPAGGAV